MYPVEETVEESIVFVDTAKVAVEVADSVVVECYIDKFIFSADSLWTNLDFCVFLY